MMIRQGEGIGVDIDIVIVLTVVVGKYPVEGIDNKEGEMKITALIEEITTSQRDRIIEKKGMKVLELWLVRIAIITSVPWVARQIILQLLLTKWREQVEETPLRHWKVIERRVPVVRRVGTGIGQEDSVPHLQDQVTHQGHKKEKTHHSNDDHTLVHLRSVVRLQVLKRKRRRVEEEGTGVQVLVLAVAEVEIGEDQVILVALPQAHVTAHRHQECIAVTITSGSISAAVVPSVAVEVITRNKINDDTKRIRRRTRRRSMKVVTLDRHEMIPSVTLAVVRAL